MKFCVLLPIWGRRYIDLFMRQTYAALRADGNLPFLARHLDCVCLFLTTEETRRYIESHPDIASIREYAAVEFVLIDDLIVYDNYGLTLTCAYARGIVSRGHAQTDTWFMFLNADFVLSDVTGETIWRIIQSGKRAILCPSVRCDEGPAAAALEVLRDPQGRIVASGRQLARISLDNPHRTFNAAFLNEHEYSTQNVNKLFWRVDTDTVIARYFMRTIMCVRPEVPLIKAEGYCDYAFFPAMVPSDNVEFVADSDDAFMLEMSPLRQEASQLQDGKLAPAELAARLSDWTTYQHRRSGEIPYLIHAADPPPNLDDERRRFDDAMAAIVRAMTPHPQPWRGHHYWQFNWIHVAKITPLDGFEAIVDARNAAAIRVAKRELVSAKRWGPFRQAIVFTSTLLCRFVMRGSTTLADLDVKPRDLLVTDQAYIPYFAKFAPRHSAPSSDNVVLWRTLHPSAVDWRRSAMKSDRVVAVLSYVNLTDFLNERGQGELGDLPFRIVTFDVPLLRRDTQNWFAELVVSKRDYGLTSVREQRIPHEFLIPINHYFDLLSQPNVGLLAFFYALYGALAMSSCALLFWVARSVQRVWRPRTGMGLVSFVLDGPSLSAFAKAKLNPGPSASNTKDQE